MSDPIANKMRELLTEVGVAAPESDEELISAFTLGKVLRGVKRLEAQLAKVEAENQRLSDRLG